MSELDIRFRCNGCGEVFLHESQAILHSRLCDQRIRLWGQRRRRPSSETDERLFIIQEPP